LDIDRAVFMKVGVHAAEALASIVARKRREEQKAGHFLWGYGGTTCHPLTQVQPFSAEASAHGAVPWLLMFETPSAHLGAGPRATEASRDGTTWERIPDELTVTGSRYAFVCSSLEPFEAEINLSEFAIGVGASCGRSLSMYFRGRVDKACAARSVATTEPLRLVSAYRARLLAPFAVYVR
jgi:hypothetical protein